MLKTCRKCGIKKPIEAFSLYRLGTDQRQSQCKGCANASGRENYKANAQRYKEKALARTAELRQKLVEAKSKPCADCGNSYPPYVMDFDHVAGGKVTNVATLMRRKFAWPIIEAEIAKCDLVCATCHRLRTYRRNVESGVWAPNFDGDF